MNLPSEEEFEAWRDQPVTQFVLEAYRRMAEAQKLAWIEGSWEAGDANPIMLVELRTRADAYQSMSECVLDDFAATVKPEIVHDIIHKPD
jgi:hypothetical protein